ncbi:DUF2336 domain-containing protein [Sphingomonas sanguinis]|uniref:DUF2336 domain-containing protein n=1 Tax=Sphingomonas sp. LC-1 TaxID=3110957 RepID=UPI0021BAE927|nr:DUF2336 domain-containing protein [Sphingomonas sp. LC-1]MCT8000672.1 DUF2336 domain-containing protein [Sphingomonas sp. LC-1]
MAVAQDPFDAPDWQHARLSERVAAARARAAARCQGAVADLRLDDDARLTDQIRFEVGARLQALVETTVSDLLHQAERLRADGEEMADPPGPAEAIRRLRRAGLFFDSDLVAELVAQLRLQLLAQALPIETMVGDAPSLLVRLTEAPDRIVASSARAVLAAEGRARMVEADGEAIALPIALRRHLVWLVAAALRQGDDAGLDQALALAAERVLAAHGEADSPGAAVLRLAEAIDARPAELPDLLLESLSDRQPGLFIALLAHACGIDHDELRDVVLEPEGDRLWLVLRSLDLGRPTVARIGLALAEADGRRDVDAFADALDAIMAIPAEAARRAIASLSLPRAFRGAIARLDQGAWR